MKEQDPACMKNSTGGKGRWHTVTVVDGSGRHLLSGEMNKAVGLRGVVQGKEDSRNVDHVPLGNWQKSSGSGKVKDQGFSTCAVCPRAAGVWERSQRHDGENPSQPLHSASENTPSTRTHQARAGEHRTKPPQKCSNMTSCVLRMYCFPF